MVISTYTTYGNGKQTADHTGIIHASIERLTSYAQEQQDNDSDQGVCSNTIDILKK